MTCEHFGSFSRPIAQAFTCRTCSTEVTRVGYPLSRKLPPQRLSSSACAKQLHDFVIALFRSALGKLSQLLSEA